jgi:hypothetical protein
MGVGMVRSSLLIGAATLVLTLCCLAATLSSGSLAYAQARRAAASTALPTE